MRKEGVRAVKDGLGSGAGGLEENSWSWGVSPLDAMGLLNRAAFPICLFLLKAPTTCQSARHLVIPPLNSHLPSKEENHLYFTGEGNEGSEWLGNIPKSHS